MTTENKIGSLQVSEFFYSIQGEGKTMGIPSFFLRLTGCNLTCGISRKTFAKSKKEGWTQKKIEKNIMPGASWVCDSHSVWRSGKRESYSSLLSKMSKLGFGNPPHTTSHLVITGGEPLLQQKKIEAFLAYLRGEGILSPIEIETNGTIVPSIGMIDRVSYFNISPKLSNSGLEEKDRVNEEAMELFGFVSKSIFKFVIANERDWQEVKEQWINKYRLRHERIWIMPAADSQEELERIAPIVAKIAIENGVKYSHRLQISIWNKKTGV